MFYAIGIDFWKSSKVYHNRLAELNNHCDDNYTRSPYCNSVECIEFLIKHPAFRDHMSYAPAKKFNDDKEHIYLEGKSSDWC
jgi:hypothetical protein